MMPSIRQLKTRLGLGLSAVLLLALAGCARVSVFSVPGKEVTALEAKDVVRLMWEAGYTEDQILEVGTDLRNALAQTGGARIKVSDKIETILMVDSPNIYVSTRQLGNFLYNLETGDIQK